MKLDRKEDLLSVRYTVRISSNYIPYYINNPLIWLSILKQEQEEKERIQFSGKKITEMNDIYFTVDGF